VGSFRHILTSQLLSFQDADLTWGDNRTYPELTKCFQDTALLWLPNIFLWLATPIYSYVLFCQKEQPIAWNWKSLSKLVSDSIDDDDDDDVDGNAATFSVLLMRIVKR